MDIGKELKGDRPVPVVAVVLADELGELGGELLLRIRIGQEYVSVKSMPDSIGGPSRSEILQGCEHIEAKVGIVGYVPQHARYGVLAVSSLEFRFTHPSRHIQNPRLMPRRLQ